MITGISLSSSIRLIDSILIVPAGLRLELYIVCPLRAVARGEEKEASLCITAVHLVVSARRDALSFGYSDGANGR